MNESMLTIKSNGSIEWRLNSQNVVELLAEEIIDRDLIRNANPNDIDRYIKDNLARKLADKMIEEDLITIYSDLDIDNTQTFRAKVKIVQE